MKGYVMLDSKIIIYSRNKCMQCKMMKNYFSGKGIPYKEVNIDEDEVGLIELKMLGFQSVPVTHILNSEGHHWIKGFAPHKVKDVMKL